MFQVALCEKHLMYIVLSGPREELGFGGEVCYGIGSLEGGLEWV